MATLTPQAAGVLTYAAASGGGDTLALAGATSARLLVRNASGGSITVTLAGVTPCSQGSTHNQAVACAAGTDTEIIPLTQTIDTATATRGNVTVTYSGVTSLTVALVAA